jgi:FkbM family methyltransferase
MTAPGRLMVREILRRAHDYHAGNWDYLRFGPDPVAGKPGQVVFNLESSTNSFLDLVAHLRDYEWGYEALADDDSRRLLTDLLAYRVLGCGHVKLPLNNERFWETYRTIDARFLKQANVARSSTFDLNLYSLAINGTDILLVSHPLAMLGLLLGQYYYEREDVSIQPEAGDVVIDGGGCWGETAIGFASAVGAAGRVYSFEFVPGNLEVFRANLSLCGELGGRVEIVEKALADQSCVALRYADCGPASALTHGAGSGGVRTLTIDDFVHDRGLDRVDFIKMDIEGAEAAALQGARQTLKRFKPKLAVCLYHKPHDPFEIPRLIRGIEGSYEFHLDHYTIHLEETVLYARAR